MAKIWWNRIFHPSSLYIIFDDFFLQNFTPSFSYQLDICKNAHENGLTFSIPSNPIEFCVNFANKCLRKITKYLLGKDHNQHFFKSIYILQTIFLAFSHNDRRDAHAHSHIWCIHTERHIEKLCIMVFRCKLYFAIKKNLVFEIYCEKISTSNRKKIYAYDGCKWEISRIHNIQ